MNGQRKFHARTVWAMALMAVATGAGCAQLGLPNPFAASPPPARPAASATRSALKHERAPTPPRSASSAIGPTPHRVRARAKAHAVAPAPPMTPAPAATTVTLGNEDQDRASAEHLINNAGAKLARIDRSKLRGDDASSYSQASGFVAAARLAIQQRDYLAASSLARKASVISDQLAARVGRP